MWPTWHEVGVGHCLPACLLPWVVVVVSVSWGGVCVCAGVGGWEGGEVMWHIMWSQSFTRLCGRTTHQTTSTPPKCTPLHTQLQLVHHPAHSPPTPNHPPPTPSPAYPLLPPSLPAFHPGRLQFCKPAAELPQLAQGQLLELVADLLREEREAAAAAGLKRPLEWDPKMEGAVGSYSYAFNNGWVPGTLNTSLANSSNAVMRM